MSTDGTEWRTRPAWGGKALTPAEQRQVCPVCLRAADYDGERWIHLPTMSADIETQEQYTAALAAGQLGSMGAEIATDQCEAEIVAGLVTPPLVLPLVDDAPHGVLPVDWNTLFNQERDESDRWLPGCENVFARGRGHAIYAAPKEGKSEFSQWQAIQAHKAGVDVLYFDWEMTDDDLWERSYNMGQRPDDLKGLHYFFRPMIPPLDTPAGAAAFLDVVDFYTRGPDVLVILDTFSRAVEGEENSNDTVRRFYSYVGVGLKDRRVTWVRLDHAGKDSTKGARGGSAKGDDVDVIWRLERTDAGCALHSTGPGAAARMSWVPARVAFTRTDDDVLAYAPAVSMWPAGTKDLAAELDRLGVALDTGERRARQEYGVRGTGSVIRAALKWRRLEADRVDVADFLDVA